MPPILLVTKVANQIIVKRCCRYSSTQGVRTGVTLALAKALVPEGKAALFNPQSDLVLLEKFALKLTRISPLIAIDSELSRAVREKRIEFCDPLSNGMVLDLSGTERVHLRKFGSYENLLQFIRSKLARAWIESRLALAPTIGAAWALSRFAGKSLSIVEGNLSSTELSRILAPLPVEALRLTSEVCAGLKQVGVSYIGELLTLSRKSLGLRFGVELVRRIDQALGSVAEALHSVEDKKIIICHQEFEIPLTTHQQIERAVLNTLSDLLNRLYKEKEKPLTLLLHLESFGIAPEHFEREISLLSGTPLASGGFSQLHSIITPIIEKVKFREGLRHITLKALHTQPAKDKQVPFSGHGGDSDQEFSHLKEEQEKLLNNFATRLGEENVKKAALNHSYIPERSFSFIPIRRKKKENNGSFPPFLLKQHPPYLLRSPETIQAIAMLPDKPPSWIKWRNEKLLVLRGAGPDRISEEWWHGKITPEIGARDYFRIQDQNGRWLWIYRDQTSFNWFIHGIWI